MRPHDVVNLVKHVQPVDVEGKRVGDLVPAGLDLDRVILSPFMFEGRQDGVPRRAVGGLIAGDQPVSSVRRDR